MLSQHPANRILRFFLEIVGLIAIGQWGLAQAPGLAGYIYMIGIPLLVALVWWVFAARDDPNGSTRVIVPVPGVTRFTIEMAAIMFAIWAMLGQGLIGLGFAFALGVLLHYFWSSDRVSWLIRH